MKKVMRPRYIFSYSQCAVFKPANPYKEIRTGIMAITLKFKQ